MSKTHYKKFFNPNYLGSYSLEPGEEKTLTVKQCVKESVTGEGGRKEDCLVCYWQEEEKPMILNVTNCKIIHKLYDTPHVEEWIGKKVTLYVSNNIRFGNETVSGLRIRPVAPSAKKKLDPARLPKLAEAIRAGSYTLDKARAQFDITPAQVKQIEELQTVVA